MGYQLCIIGLLHIDVDDVTALYKKIREQVTTIKGLHDTFYGAKEFYIADINGSVIASAQTIKS